MTVNKQLWLLGIVGLIVAGGIQRKVAQLIPAHFTPDSVYYHQLAINLIEGKGFSLVEGTVYRPVHEHTPGYSLFLAAVYRLFPGNNDLSEDNIRVKAALWIQQGLLWISLFVFASGFGHLVKSKRWVYGYLLLSFIYLPYAVAGNYLLSEGWGIFLLSWLFWGLTNFKEHKRLFYWVLMGLTLGLVVMVRPALLVWLPAYGYWLLVYGKPYLHNRFRLGVLITLGLLIPVMVWIVRTGVATRHWVPVQVGVARVLVSGGCPGSVCGINYQRLKLPIDPVFLPSKPSTASFNPVYLWWWYNVKKFRDLLGFPFGYFDLRVHGIASSTLEQGLFWGQLLILFTMMAGGFKTLRQKTKMTLPVVLFLTGLLAHSLFWSEPRYALPYMPVILGLSTYGAWAIYDYRKTIKRQWKLRGFKLMGGMLFMVLLITIAMLPEYVGWNLLRTMANYLIWLLALGILLWFGFGRVKYKFFPGLTMFLFCLAVWSLLMALWQPVRLNLWSEAPKNDYLFPVGITIGSRQWL